MPLGIVVEVVIQVVAEVVLNGVCYLTGSVVVPAFTLGRWTVAPIDRSVRHRPRLPAHRATGTRNREVSADAAVFFGLLFWAVVGIIGLLVWLGIR
jgi:hypothetical protein